MSFQIIIQPNKRFALWCASNKELICYDASKDELVEFMINHHRAAIYSQTSKIIKMIKSGQNPYRSRAQTWEGIIEYIRETEGEEELKSFLLSLAKNDSK